MVLDRVAGRATEVEMKKRPGVSSSSLSSYEPTGMVLGRVAGRATEVEIKKGYGPEMADWKASEEGQVSVGIIG